MAYVLVKLLQRDINVATKALRPVCVNLSQRKESGYICHYFSSDSAKEGEKDILNVEDEEMAARDVSRLPKKYRDRMKHIMNPPEKPDWYADMFQTIEYKRKLYGKFGRKSGLDPGILWPSKEEVKEQMEFEKEWEPSLEDMLKSLEDERQSALEAREKKRQTVEKQMARMPQFIKEYHAKLEKAAEQERQHEAKKRALLEEARDYFGYSIDPRDARFEEMKLQKEEEEKKQRKKEKKEAKALRLAQAVLGPKPQQ